jgi:putative membrane protein
MRFIIRWAITAFALFVASWLVHGIHVEGNALGVFVATALILGLINALVRPVLKLLSCPLILLTLGLFVLIVNAICLKLASYIAQHWFHLGFYVRGFGSAFWGALIVSIVSVILSAILGENKKHPSP